VCSQHKMFDTPKSTLSGGVVYFPTFINAAEADDLFEAFLKLDWMPNPYRPLGHRPKCVWMGVPTSSTALSSRVIVTEWTSEALRVKQRVEEAAGHSFDSLQLNLYRDESDALYWHFDGEAEGRMTSPIASVSFGAERRFKWRCMKDAGTYTQSLAHGSVLIMPPGFQQDYRHSVLSQKKVCGKRINLTFRRKGA
jgi:alkylated DNA repair dioxygenase AlkB